MLNPTDPLTTALHLERVWQGVAPLSGSSDSTPAARVDVDRATRCGYPEVIYAPGKTSEQIASVSHALLEAGQNVLITRLDENQRAAMGREFPAVEFSTLGRTAIIWHHPPELRGRVLVITAGTGDLPVAEEALETARWMGCQTHLIADVGVAGPQRLLAVVPTLRTADALVVVAGMEGALPSVVAGWVSAPVIAVPTSIGYGAHLGGLTTLLGMMTSCAANVAVVNIDAGFKGGFMAGLIVRGLQETGAVTATGAIESVNE